MTNVLNIWSTDCPLKENMAERTRVCKGIVRIKAL